MLAAPLLALAPLLLQAGYSPLDLSHTAYVKATDPDTGDRFGRDVDVSGDRMIVGMPDDDSDSTGIGGDPLDNQREDSGAAWIYVNVGGSWVLEAFIKSPAPEAFGWFGSGVAIDGDRAVVGAFGEKLGGAAHVYHHDGSAWTYEGTVVPHNPSDGARYGNSVDISGTTVVIGSPFESGAGALVNPPVSYSMIASGAAYVYELVGGTWQQSTYLKSSAPDSNDQFGSVAISGDLIVVGAPNEGSSATGVDGQATDNGATGSGAAYVYRRVPGSWALDAYLKASNTRKEARFGGHLDLDGTTLVVGSYTENSAATGVGGDELDTSAPSAGAAYVFERSAGIWSQTAYLKAINAQLYDHFGLGVGISGDVIAVSAPDEDSARPGLDGVPADNSMSSAGAVYLFRRDLSGWSTSGFIKAPNPDTFDSFGSTPWYGAGGPALDGNTLVVGTMKEDSASGADPADNLAQSSGAVYTYDLGLGTRVTSYGPGAPVHPVLLGSADTPQVGQPFVFDISDPAGASVAFLVLATAKDSSAHFGGTLLVDWSSQLLPPPGMVLVPLAAGLGSKTIVLAPGTTGLTVYAQAAVPAHGQPAGWALSNGLELLVGP